MKKKLKNESTWFCYSDGTPHRTSFINGSKSKKEALSLYLKNANDELRDLEVAKMKLSNYETVLYDLIFNVEKQLKKL